MEKVAGKSTRNVNRLRSFCIKISKTLNNISPAIMNEIFELWKTNRTIRNQYKLNQEVPIINQVTFGAKSIRHLFPEKLNSLSSESPTAYKRIIKDGDMVSSKWPICQR